MDLSCIATDHPEMKMMSLDAHTWMVRCRWTRSPPQCCRKISRSRPSVENRETINPRAHGRPPHDIQHREFTSGKSRKDTLAGMGIEATVVPQSNVLMASTLSGGCLTERGATAIGASAVLRHFASIDANGTITSKTGPRRRSTIRPLTVLMRFGPLRVDLTMAS